MPLDGKLSDYEQKIYQVLSPEGLRDWFKTMSPGQKYEFADIRGNCLIGQYLLANGFNSRSWHQGYTYFFDRQISFHVACAFPMTMGSALVRCEALLAQTQ